MGKHKIASVETFLVHEWMLVRITTEDGQSPTSSVRRSALWTLGFTAIKVEG